MIAPVKESKERRLEKGILTPTRKKNMGEQSTRHRGQLTGYNPIFSFNHTSTDTSSCASYSATSITKETDLIIHRADQVSPMPYQVISGILLCR